jgi:hypothetical protein
MSTVEQKGSSKGGATTSLPAEKTNTTIKPKSRGIGVRGRKRMLDFGGTHKHVVYNVRVNAPSVNTDLELELAIQSFRQIAEEAGLDEAKSRIDKMVDVFRSNIPAPRFSLAEARMIAKAQEKTILATKWVTAKDIAELAGYRSENKTAGVFKWKASNKIFGVKYQSEELYPIYALNKDNGFRPHPGLKPVLELFIGKRDSWGIAYWFAAANGYLGGKRPQDLIADQPDLVLKAAIDSLQGVIHG